MEHTKPQKEETPFERFKRFTTQVVSVPRAEIQKRECSQERAQAAQEPQTASLGHSFSFSDT